jgi:PAS domain S-box-containing protein
MTKRRSMPPAQPTGEKGMNTQQPSAETPPDRAALERENAALRAALADAQERLGRAEAAVAGWQVIPALEQAPSLIGVFRGPDLVLEFANAAYRAAMGPRTMVGRPLAELFPELVGRGNLALMQQAYRSGEAVTQNAAPTWIHDQVSGALREEWSSFIYQPLRNACGEVDGILFLVAVITAEVEARQQVEQLNAELRTFRALVEQTPDAACLVSPSGALTYTNPAFRRLFGPGATALSALALLAPAARPQLPAIRATLRASGVWTGVVPLRAADGHTFPASVSLAALVEPGQPVMLAAIVRDATGEVQAAAERLAFERSLPQTQKLESLGILAGGIAHDFNNLLVAILGNADLALADLAPDDPAHGSVQQIQAAARHAADLTRQLLAYSGKGRVLVEARSLNVLIDEMVIKPPTHKALRRREVGSTVLEPRHKGANLREVRRRERGVAEAAREPAQAYAHPRLRHLRNTCDGEEIARSRRLRDRRRQTRPLVKRRQPEQFGANFLGCLARWPVDPEQVVAAIGRIDPERRVVPVRQRPETSDVDGIRAQSATAQLCQPADLAVPG